MTPGEIRGLRDALRDVANMLATVDTLPRPMDLYYPVSRGEGRGWQYRVTGMLVSDIARAADALDALHAKIAALEGELDALLAERDAASARVGEMREALELAEPLIETLDSLMLGRPVRKTTWKALKTIRARLARGEG